MEHFHLLRAQWLWALVPMALIVWGLWRGQAGNGIWSRVCDPRLLPHLLADGARQPRNLVLALLALAWLLGVLALAGPTWSQLPQPVYRGADARVFVLDLSRSMDAADLKPSRLERARFKLLDMLRRSKAGQNALLVFAGEPFVVSPLTDDEATIAAMVPSLDTDMMPLQGSRTALAIQRAAKLLQQAGQPRGQVVLITDGLDDPAATLDAVKQLRAQGASLSVLALGSKQGAPIPSADGFIKDNAGGIVVAHTPFDALRQLATSGGGQFARLSADDRDINTVLEHHHPLQSLKSAGRTRFEADRWLEQGPWLVILLLPLGALAFRRGWLFVVPVVLVFGLAPARPARAMDWNGLWARPDQQAAHALQQGQTKQAEQLFRDPRWKAIAAYKSGDYQQALKHLEGQHDAAADYNRGNALAKLGKLDQALAAYQAALAANPDDADARHNRDLVKQLLEKRKQSNSTPQHGGQTGKSEPGKKHGNSGEQHGNGQHNGTSQQDRTGRQHPGKDSRGTGQSEQDKTANPSSPDSGAGKPSQAANTAQMAGRAAQPDRAHKPRQSQQAAAQGHQDTGQPTHQSEQPQASIARSQHADGAQARGTVASPPSGTNPQQSEQAQATEQWLQRIPDDPGGLLRRKFLLQHQQGPYRNQQEVTPW